MKNTGYKLYIVNGKLYMTLFFIVHFSFNLVRKKSGLTLEVKLRNDKNGSNCGY